VAGAGVSQSVCLPLLSVYQQSTTGSIQGGAASFWVAVCHESLLCPALQAVAGEEPFGLGDSNLLSDLET